MQSARGQRRKKYIYVSLYLMSEKASERKWHLIQDAKLNKSSSDQEGDKGLVRKGQNVHENTDV